MAGGSGAVVVITILPIGVELRTRLNCGLRFDCWSFVRRLVVFLLLWPL